MAKAKAESVDDFLSTLKHPMKKEIEEIRKVILGSHKGLIEQIKWNAPSYSFRGDDRITFNLSDEGVIRLIFHCGVKPSNKKLKSHLYDDSTGLLEWVANDRAMAKL